MKTKHERAIKASRNRKGDWPDLFGREYLNISFFGSFEMSIAPFKGEMTHVSALTRSECE